MNKFIKSVDNVNLEVPPEQFNYDFSSNVCLVLSRENKINPILLA